MHLIKFKDLVINMDLVAKAERLPDGTVIVHYVAPDSAKIPPRGGSPIPAGHFADTYSGPLADEIWKQIQAI